MCTSNAYFSDVLLCTSNARGAILFLRAMSRQNYDFAHALYRIQKGILIYARQIATPFFARGGYSKNTRRHTHTLKLGPNSCSRGLSQRAGALLCKTRTKSKRDENTCCKVPSFRPGFIEFRWRRMTPNPPPRDYCVNRTSAAGVQCEARVFQGVGEFDWRMGAVFWASIASRYVVFDGALGNL